MQKSLPPSIMATINQPLLETRKTSDSKILFLLLISSAALIGTVFFAIPSTRTTSSSTPPNPKLSLHNICDRTVNIESCLAMTSETTRQYPTISDHHDLLKAFLKQTTPRIQEALEMASDISRRINVNPKERAALLDCEELMELSKDGVMDSLSTLYFLKRQRTSFSNSHDDVHTWLSSVLTNHVTCLDGLEESGNTYVMTLMESHLKDLILRARASLAILVSSLSPSKSDGDIDRALDGDYPTWVSAGDRKLLGALGKEIKPNVVVAQDGSGDYKTLNQALAVIPKKSKTRFVIFVTRGIYKEKVDFQKNHRNVMLVGDGMDYTIITGSLNNDDGTSTFKSATVAAVGEGFIAQDIWFQNTAGPQKHQAVALRIGADKSVINRCRIDAYQDTLYAHSHRQFYRDCTITGTVDFIFGNAAVVLQRCKIIPRKPMDSQKNMVTAQGRTDPNQNTGTSIQNCEIFESQDLEPVKDSFPSFLGRPWKEYSRTVVMESHIGDVIDPAGWFEWDGDFALSTLFYGEYKNWGPGSGTCSRVKWSGYHVLACPSEAQKFTVAELIQGGSWLESTGVPYTEGLYIASA